LPSRRERARTEQWPVDAVLVELADPLHIGDPNGVVVVINSLEVIHQDVEGRLGWLWQFVPIDRLDAAVTLKEPLNLPQQRANVPCL